MLLFFKFSDNTQCAANSKESTGRQHWATQKQHSFSGLFKFIGRTQPAYSSKIMYKVVNKKTLYRRGTKSGRSTKTTTRNDKIKRFCVVFSIVMEKKCTLQTVGT